MNFLKDILPESPAFEIPCSCMLLLPNFEELDESIILNIYCLFEVIPNLESLKKIWNVVFLYFFDDI